MTALNGGAAGGGESEVAEGNIYDGYCVVEATAQREESAASAGGRTVQRRRGDIVLSLHAVRIENGRPVMASIPAHVRTAAGEAILGTNLRLSVAWKDEVQRHRTSAMPPLCADCIAALSDTKWKDAL